MTLRKRVLFYIGSTLIVAILIIYVFSRFILLASFARIEENDTRQNVNRALFALNSRLTELYRMTGDYSTWDDTYQFIKDRNKKYINNNLTETTFNNLKINLMVFTDSAGHALSTTFVDLITGKFSQPPRGINELLATRPELYRHGDPAGGLKGLIMLPQGPMVIAARPIVTSLGKGPIRGALIFGRFIDKTFIASLAQTTDLSIEVKPLTDQDLPPDLGAAIPLLTRRAPLLVRPLNGDRAAGYAIINDVFDQPALILRVDLPRHVFKQGQATVLAFAGLFLLAGLAIIFLIIFLMERTFLSRLAGLHNDVVKVGATGDLALPVAVPGQDELSLLANEIQRAFKATAIAQKKRNESEKKFEKLFDSIPEAIYLEKFNGQIVDCNPAAVKMTGYSRQELLRLNAADLVAPEVARTFPNLIEEIKLSGGIFIESQNKKKSGEFFPVETSIQLLELGGENYALVVVRDITERKRAEQELKSHIKELEDFQAAVVSRELRMIELEKELDRLRQQPGQADKSDA